MSIDVERHAERRLPPWLLPAAGLLLIGLVGLLFATADFSGEEGASESPEVTFRGGIPSNQAPDFEGSVVASLTLARIPSLLTWGSEDDAPTVVTTATRDMRFNVDATQFAGVERIGDQAGVLWAGPLEDTSVVARDVTAFAWHASQPGLIAMSRSIDGASLWVASLGPDLDFSIVLLDNIEPDSVVVGFDEWGFALHTAPDADGNRATILLDSSGSEVSRIDGLVAAVLPGDDGGVLIADPLGELFEATWDGPPAITRMAPERILKVVWSEDRGSYAEMSDGAEPGVDVLYVNTTVTGDAVTHMFEGYEPFAWDASGRFLAAAGDVRLVVIDAADGSIHELGVPPTRVYDVRLLP